MKIAEILAVRENVRCRCAAPRSDLLEEDSVHSQDFERTSTL